VALGICGTWCGALGRQLSRLVDYRLWICHRFVATLATLVAADLGQADYRKRDQLVMGARSPQNSDHAAILEMSLRALRVAIFLALAGVRMGATEPYRTEQALYAMGGNDNRGH